MMLRVQAPGWSFPALLLVAVALTGCAGNVFSLEVGTCFDEPAEMQQTEQVGDVPLVDCDQPHDMEVFHLADHPDGDYPGDAAIARFAEDVCVAAFEAFVGIGYWDSELDVAWLSPTADSWETGDREVVCALYRLDGEQMTGSMRGRGV